MAVVSIATVESLVVQQMAVAVSYTVTPASGTRVYANGIRDAILAVDAEICLAIINSPNNARRRDFILSAALADNAQLPSHIGPLGAVRINGKPSSLVSLDLVRRTRINALLLPVDPYHCFFDQRIYHNATSANFSTTTADVDYYSFTVDGSTFLCQAPSEYTAAEFAGAMALLASVDGDDVQQAGLYQSIFNVYMQMISGGAQVIPDMGQMMEQRAA